MVMPSQGGEQATLCLPLRKLTGWLMTLQPSRMDDAVAAKVLLYQNECDDALWDYWTKGVAVNPRANMPVKALIPDFEDPLAAAEGWIEQYKGRKAAEQDALVAQQAVQQLEAKVVVDAPRVAFAASVEASETSYLVGQVAKIIKRGTGIDVGQNRLFVWLRDQDYIHKGGSQHNEPTQRTQDMGLMFVSERVSTTKDGKEMVTRTPRITGKGKLFFYERFHRIALKRGLVSQAVPLEMVQQNLFAGALLQRSFLRVVD